MQNIFAYVRVSTEEQALHGLSIEAQTAKLRAWAAANGHRIIDLYIDAGISARKPAGKRPALQRLLKDVQDGKGDMVIFTKLDRWFRNIAEYYKVQEVLEKSGVNWRTIEEDYDTSTASGRLKINIMLSVAQDEADRTSERIKAVMEVKRSKLEAVTGQMPFGYVLREKKIVKDPETEDLVNEIFHTYLASGSISRVRQRVRDRFGTTVEYMRLHKMLGSTAYYGRYFDTDGMAPPYITKKDYDKIQSLRRRIVRKTAKNRVYIFSGLVVCGECGHRMGARVNTNQESRFYNCAMHYVKDGECTNNINLSEKKIEKFLLDSIQHRMEAWKIEAAKLYEQKKGRDHKSEINGLRAKLGKLKELYLNDLITMEEYKKDHAEYTEKIISLEQDAADMMSPPDFSKADELLCSGWEAVYSGMQMEQKQLFWRILVKEIRVFKDRHIEYDLNV